MSLGAQGVLAQFLAGQVQPVQHHLHIAHGAVSGLRTQAMALHDGVKPMAAVLRVELARQAHGAHGFHTQHGVEPRKFLHQKAVVKAHVVGHQHRAGQQFQQLAGNRLKAGCIGHHGVADAGQAFNETRDAHPRVHQAAPARHLHAVVHAHGSNFCDAVVHRVATSGFQVKQYVTGEHVGSEKTQQKISASQAGSSTKLSST